jgi:hypothetical protein
MENEVIPEDLLRRARKYKIYWAAFLSNIVLLVWKLISADNFVDLQIFTFGLYMAGNVGEHFSRKKT